MPELLDDAAITAAVDGLSWERDGDRLVKEATFADFKEAMRFVNAVADAAEAANHHPDISISWNKVSLSLWTHTAGGITANDIDLAKTVDGLEKP